MTPPIGRRIAAVRRSIHMTQAQLATASCSGHNTIASIENGRRSPSLNTLERICEALDVSPAALYDDNWRTRCQRSGILLEETL